MVEQFHSHGVKVFFPLLVWDAGTRGEDAAASGVMAQLLKDIDADGINFDTLESVPPGFREASDATLLGLQDLGPGSVTSLRETLGLPSTDGVRPVGLGLKAKAPK